MVTLKTLYTSNVPMDCYIVKGRLKAEGVDSFAFDENIVWVHPFRAVAIGGVKLKVPSDQFEIGSKILNQIHQGKLFDDKGEYEIAKILDLEFERQMEILKVKSDLRKNPSLIRKPNEIIANLLHEDEMAMIIEYEKEFQILKNKRLNFSWKDFFYELFDMDRSVFTYLRTRPIEYYLEKEAVEESISNLIADFSVSCPKCKSDNVIYGHAIDFKWDFLYLILSLILTPFPPFRKKYHCYHCGHNFKRKDIV